MTSLLRAQTGLSRRPPMRLSPLLVGLGLVGVWLFAQSRLKVSTPASPTLPVFRDVTARAGVKFKNESSHTSQKYLIETMGAGVAMLDYDGDGRMDLFFVNGARLQDPMPAAKQPDKSEPRYWNRLYRNNGDGTFTDVTAQAGVQGDRYGMGVAVGDYDNDGYPDIYVTNFGRNILYHNNGDGTFTDVTAKAGVAGGGWSSSAAFVDYDRDGYLDIAVARYLDWDFSMNVWCGDRTTRFRAFCLPTVFKPAGDLLFRNKHDGTFTDVSAPSGFGTAPGNGLGIAVNDFDQDGWPDIMVANDVLAQQLFRNTGKGTFIEEGLLNGLAYDDDGRAFSGMGVDFEDYDNDGLPDVFITALANQRYAIFRNAPPGFRDVAGVTRIAALTAAHSGWGAKFIDYDNDGWKDLFIAQGHVMDNIEVTQPGVHYLEAPMLLRNVRGVFEDVSARSGPPFAVPLAARGAAFGDLDNDGFLDVAINCNEGKAVILRNSGNASHWILIDTVGALSNRDGIGARIHIVSESGFSQWATVTRAGSYLSSSDKRVHFGIGRDKLIRSVEVEWPSGITQKLENVRVDQILTIREQVVR